MSKTVERRRAFAFNCAVRERTQDGRSVGRCWHHVGKELRCERHGNVRSVQEHYELTGELTDENLLTRPRDMSP